MLYIPFNLNNVNIFDLILSQIITIMAMRKSLFTLTNMLIDENILERIKTKKKKKLEDLIEKT